MPGGRTLTILFLGRQRFTMPTRANVIAILFAAMTLVLVLPGPALAADPRYPDWPCNQIKVPEISVAAVWSGPAIDDAHALWQNDAEIADLVPRLSARRTPVEQAEELIAQFLIAHATQKQEKAKLLFAGLFDVLNRERSTVMNGIERHFHKQKELAEAIRSEVIRLNALQDQADRDQKKIDDLAEQIGWDTRIFEERKKTIGYACEVPSLIERRLFALARAIQQVLE
jgi:hypothetical protein